jgi:glycosyltransferase involved in cell wall biosynthesis
MRDLSSIHVESYTMIDKLKELGMKQTHYLPNFKRLNALTEDKLIFNSNAPYKLCTFSRVTKEKGIEEAVSAVVNINDTHQKTVCTLDIYGAIDESYKERFAQLMESSKDCITYKGVVPYDQSVEVLKEYFLLLFPTYYPGEGFAGTLLDSFASGVPVLASNWRYNHEIVKPGISGYLYELEDSLQTKLEDIFEEPESIERLKRSCLEEYRKYSPDYVMNNFLGIIKEGPTNKNFVGLSG